MTTAMSFRAIPTRLAVAKSTTPNVEDVGKWKFSYTASDHKLVQPLRRAILNYLSKLTMSNPKDPSDSTARGVISEKLLFPTHENPRIRMLWAELCIGETDLSLKTCSK